MKPSSAAQRLARAYRKIGKRCTERQAAAELERTWRDSGLNPWYVVASAENIGKRKK